MRAYIESYKAWHETGVTVESDSMVIKLKNFGAKAKFEDRLTIQIAAGQEAEALEILSNYSIGHSVV